jgi:uroporphyrinogen-III synthase
VEPFVPSRPLGETLAAELPVSPGERVILVRSDIADPGLVADVEARGAAVIEVIGYRTHEGPESSRGPLSVALAEPVDALAFASGSAVRGLLALASPAETVRLRGTPAVCIGPTTAAAARSLGFTAVVEAADPAPAALVAGVVEALATTSRPTTARGDP